MDWLWVLLGLVILAASGVWSAITSAPLWLWFALFALLALGSAIGRVVQVLVAIEQQLALLNERLRTQFPTRDEIEDENEDGL